MPKKSRRAKARQRAAVAQAVQDRRSQQPRLPSAEVQSPIRKPAKIPAPKAQDSTSRYQYVMPEVKRIAIIAGSIIVVLIILSFILG